MSNGRNGNTNEQVTVAHSSDGDAFGRLDDEEFDRVYDVVVHLVPDRDIAAEVAQDVLLVAWQNRGAVREPGFFGAWLLREAHSQALNRLETDRGLSSGDQETVTDIDRSHHGSDAVVASGPQADPLDLMGAVIAALGERATGILSLHLRHGISGKELAAELRVSADATNRSMFRLRTALGDAVHAWALWEGGKPSCDRLRSVLDVAAVSRFGRDAARVITSHTKTCGACEWARAEMAVPEEQFAAIPIVAAPAGLKAAADDSKPPPAEGALRRVTAAYGKLPHTASWVVVAAALLLLVPALGAIVWIVDVGEVDLARLTGTPDTSVSTSPPDASSADPSAPTEDTSPGADPSATTDDGPVDGTRGSKPPQPTDDESPRRSSTPTSSTSTLIPPSSSTTSTSTLSTSTSSSSTTQPLDQLDIVALTATREPRPEAGCSRADERIVLSWKTTGADNVNFEGSTLKPGGTPGVNGTTVVCSPEAQAFVLNAFNADSSVSQTAGVNSL